MEFAVLVKPNGFVVKVPLIDAEDMDEIIADFLCAEKLGFVQALARPYTIIYDGVARQKKLLANPIASSFCIGCLVYGDVLLCGIGCDGMPYSLLSEEEADCLVEECEKLRC